LLKIQNCKFFTSADLQHFRIRTLLNFTIPVQNAPGMPPKAASPREAGSAQASLACRARSVPFPHRLIYHGIVKNSELRILHFC
jgi:hypothetical protein